jgi:hypothetical protein
VTGYAFCCTSSTQAFYDVSLGRQMANFEVNAGAAVRVTHHFSGLMLKKGLRGFIGYTSSPAGMYSLLCALCGVENGLSRTA